MEPRSLFLMVSYDGNSTCSSSILHLDTLKGCNSGFGPHFNPPPSLPDTDDTGVRPLRRWRSFSNFGATDVNQKEYVAHFGRPQGPASISWVFSHMTSKEEELLYMVPYCDPQNHNIDVPLLNGFIFNLTTKTCRSFNHPNANKFGGRVLNLFGYLYFIADPSWDGYTPSPSFESYDPVRDSWKTLEPFPFDLGNAGNIEATAVCDDTIMFNIGGVELWAYNVYLNKWHPVEVDDEECYSIVGEAVVLANTIYALAETPFNLILALSLIRKRVANGDFVYKCCLLSHILVRGLKPFDILESYSQTRRLCQLGKDSFCLVESCSLYGYPTYQPIQLTNIKLLKKGHSMTVTNVCGHLLRIPDDRPFGVDFCFSLPDSKATALKEGKSFHFALNPYPKNFDPHQKRKDLHFSEPKEDSVTASGRSNTDEGHSIYVRNISPFATCNQLKKGLAKFGPVDRIRIITCEEGETFALVHFKSATSKKHAMQTSTVTIADCRAVLE